MDSAYIHEVADAIRKNGLKQTFGTWFKDNGGGNPTAACAIGQAAHNLGIEPGLVTLRLNKAHENGGYYPIECPSKEACYRYDGLGAYSTSISNIVIHLNDWHRWKFSSIANWLDKVADNG